MVTTSPPTTRRMRSRSRSRSRGEVHSRSVAKQSATGVPFRTQHQKAPLFYSVACVAVFVSIFGSVWPIYVLAHKYLAPSSDASTNPTNLTFNPVPKFIQAATLFFVLAMSVEFLFGRMFMSAGGQYRLPDTMSSMTSGLMQISWRLVMPVTSFFAIVPYNYVWQNFSVYRIEMDHPLKWIAVFMLVDLAYYAFHRAAHEINFMWAGHVVHHSSENYNLSTALRQGVLQDWTSWVPYVALAFFFPPEVYATSKAWNTLYQFWVHTTVIRRMPALIEFIFMTPSHHRVHHDRRVHCNYGGVFIIWDRMFNSFIDEGETLSFTRPSFDQDERVVYGILTSPASWNPFVLQFHHVAHIAKRMWEAKTLTGKWHALWRGPGWRPLMRRRTPPVVSPFVPRIRYTVSYSTSLGVYLFVHFVLAVAITVSALNLEVMAIITSAQAVVIALLAFGTLGVHGSVLDGRAWARTLEKQRVVVLTASSVALLYNGPSDLMGNSVVFGLVAATAAVHVVSLVAVLVHPSLLVATSHLDAVSAVPVKQD